MINTILNIKPVEVTYHSKNHVLYLEWKNNTSTEEYQRIMIECLEFGRNYRIDSVISDIRKQKHVNSDHRKWFETQVLPTAILKLGIKRAAAIFDGSSLQQQYLKNIKKITDKYNIPLKFTTNEETAFRWVHLTGFNLKELLLGHSRK